MEKYILLDRDGVINFDSDDYIKSEDEWQPIESSLRAIKILHDNGFKIIIITNQSGVGRGYYSIETLENIHQKMKNAAEKAGGTITDIFYCPHAPESQCDCRKPAPGLITAAIDKYSFDPKTTYMVGDSLRDLLAGEHHGMKLALVKTGKGSKTLQTQTLPKQTECYNNLLELVNYLIQ